MIKVSYSKLAVNFALYTIIKKVFNMYSHVCNINNDDMIDRLDTTRVEYIIPLRESFSLPFLWVQIAATTYYFRHNCSPQKEVFLYHNCPFFRSSWYFNRTYGNKALMFFFQLQFSVGHNFDSETEWNLQINEIFRDSENIYIFVNIFFT